MKIKIALAIVVAMVAGCTQNPIGNPQSSQPTTMHLESCGLSVRFSGQPDVTRGELLTKLSEGFGTPSEGQHGLFMSTKQGVLKIELAMCVCPPDPKLTETKVNLMASGKIVDGIGRTLETPVIEADGGVKFVTKTTEGDNFPGCFVFQASATNGTPEETRAASASFFASILALPKPPRKTGIFRTDGSAAQKLQQLEESPTGKYTVERLKLLDQLLKEKLITPEEFNTRRAKIIDNL